MKHVFAFVACLAVFAPASLAAQHDYPEIEVARGGQFFRGNCAGCHGQDGDLVDGVRLTDPQFLGARTEAQLIAVIMNGVPGTTMPPSNYSDLQARNIVAYLTDLSQSGRGAPVDGDPERGRALVETMGCLNCHAIGRAGSPVGPDLSTIGLVRRTDELAESLTDPGAVILPENRYVRVVAGGVTVTGRLLNHDRVTVHMIDSDERLRTFEKAGLDAFEILEESPMPSFADRLDAGQIDDVLSYLVSLKGSMP